MDRRKINRESYYCTRTACCVAMLLLFSPLGARLALGQTISITVLVVSTLQEPHTQDEALSSVGSSIGKIQAEVGSLPDEIAIAEPTQQSGEADSNETVVQVPEKTQGDSTTELSVRPSFALLPAEHPQWISNEPDYKSATHRFVVASIPTAHKTDVDSNLDVALEESMRSYMNQLWGEGAATDHVSQRLSAAFIRSTFLDDGKSYLTELDTSSGPMFQKWVMLEVTPKQREQLQHWHREQIQRERLLPLGLAVGGIVSILGVCHLSLRRLSRGSETKSLLKIVDDQATSGGCCKKSRFGYAFAIAIAVAVAVLVSS